MSPQDIIKEVERQEALKAAAPQVKYVQTLFGERKDVEAEITLLGLRLEHLNNVRRMNAEDLEEFGRTGNSKALSRMYKRMFGANQKERAWQLAGRIWGGFKDYLSEMREFAFLFPLVGGASGLVLALVFGIGSGLHNFHPFLYSFLGASLTFSGFITYFTIKNK